MRCAVPVAAMKPRDPHPIPAVILSSANAGVVDAELGLDFVHGHCECLPCWRQEGSYVDCVDLECGFGGEAAAVFEAAGGEGQYQLRDTAYSADWLPDGVLLRHAGDELPVDGCLRLAGGFEHGRRDAEISAGHGTRELLDLGCRLCGGFGLGIERKGQKVKQAAQHHEERESSRDRDK